MRRFTLHEDINNVEWSSPIEFLSCFDIACSDIALADAQIEEPDYRQLVLPSFYQSEEIQRIFGALADKILYLIEKGDELQRLKEEKILQDIKAKLAQEIRKSTSIAINVEETQLVSEKFKQKPFEISMGQSIEIQANDHISVSIGEMIADNDSLRIAQTMADEAKETAERERAVKEAEAAELKKRADEVAAEEKRKADEAAKATEEQRKASEEKRKADEAAEATEQKKKADEAAKVAAEEKRLADEAAKAA